IVLEKHSRPYVEERVRAGVLEQGTVDLLVEMGLGERMAREGLVHYGIEVQFTGQRHRIDFKALTGKGITVYGQNEVVKDLTELRLTQGNPIVFEAEDVSIHGLSSDHPTIRYSKDGNEVEVICDFIAGCDGFHGICRSSIPCDVLTVYER